MRRDYEFDSRSLVGVEDGAVLRKELHPRLIAISAVDIVVSVLLVVVGNDPVRALARGLGVAFLPLVVNAADKDVRPHADLLHKVDCSLEFL